MAGAGPLRGHHGRGHDRDVRARRRRLPLAQTLAPFTWQPACSLSRRQPPIIAPKVEAAGEEAFLHSVHELSAYYADLFSPAREPFSAREMIKV